MKLGLVIAVSAVLLASCSGEGDDASSTSVSSTTAAPVSSTTAAPVSSTTAAPVSSTTVARPVFGSLEELAEHRYAGGLGAVIVGVFEDSSPHVAGIGEDGDGVAVDADRPWHTASLANVFTAAAFLQLVDDGSIDLDGPISDYVDFPVSDQITVRHVLGHR